MIGFTKQIKCVYPIILYFLFLETKNNIFLLINFFRQ